MLEHFFQSRTTATAIFVQAVAVGAFDDQNIGFVGRFRCRQDRRMWRPQVAGKYDAFLLARLGVVQINLDICLVEDVASAL